MPFGLLVYISMKCEEHLKRNYYENELLCFNLQMISTKINNFELKRKESLGYEHFMYPNDSESSMVLHMVLPNDDLLLQI